MVESFLLRYRDAFGDAAPLPIAFGYGDNPATECRRIPRCMIGAIRRVCDEGALTLCADNVLCGGGSLYTAFASMQERIPGFVSEVEHYKKGGWGLVWDGDSLESCTSFAGEYLRYIAPHKLSMYLAAGLPVIVWKESAEAEFIEKNKLGITVDNLNNIEEILNALPKEKIQIINNNVKNISKKLRNGEMTKHVLDINCKYPNMTYCLKE